MLFSRHHLRNTETQHLNGLVSCGLWRWLRWRKSRASNNWNRFWNVGKAWFQLVSSNWNYCLNRKNITFMVLNKWNSVLTCFNQQTIMQNLALSNNTVESSRKNRASRWFNHQELHRTKHYADLGDNNLYMNNLSLATKLGYEYLYVYYIYIYIHIQQQKHWLLGVYRVIGYIEWLALAAQENGPWWIKPPSISLVLHKVVPGPSYKWMLVFFEPMKSSYIHHT